MSIRARLAALFTLAALVLVIAGSFLFVTQLRTQLEAGVDSRPITREQSVAAALEERRVRPGERLTNANGIYTQVLDLSGAVRNTAHGLPAAPLLSGTALAAASHHTLSFNRTVPLTAGDDIAQEPMRLRAVPLPKLRLVMVVATSRVVVDAAVRRATEQLVVLCGVVLVLAAVGGWLLARAALRPVERMRRAVAAVPVGEIGEGIAVPRTRDEIARLGRTFNELLLRLRDATERERAFVSDAGHELRTPLAVLKGELELAQHPGRTLTELRETVSIAAEETERLVRLAEDLLFLARSDEAPELRLAAFDLVVLLDQAIRALSATSRQREVAVSLVAPEQLVVCAERDRIRRAVDNVLVNALRFVPPGGWIRVEVAAVDNDVVICVSDSGPGFPPEFLPHAFERFSRLPNPGDADDARGNGLGLAIVTSVMTGHGGTATAANGPTGGAVVTLRWPRDASAGAEAHDAGLLRP